LKRGKENGGGDQSPQGLKPIQIGGRQIEWRENSKNLVSGETEKMTKNIHMVTNTQK